MLDPGLGFAKTASHNWALLRHLDALDELGLPLLVGASRKSFLGTLLAGPDGTPRAVDDREHAGVALSMLLAQHGVWGIRVHDVRATADALAVWEAMAEPRPTRPGRGARMTDELRIEGLRCFGHHGVFDFERREGQVFVLDLVLGLDTRPAAASDDLRDTVDYGSLVGAVKSRRRARPGRPDRDPGRQGRRPVPDGRPC